MCMQSNFLALENELRQKLHGQHLVADTVVRSVRGHFTNPEPEKALVLSFHGCTGCGKNFVSKIIASAMYKLGMQSAYIHLFVSTHHFPHEDLIETYKVCLYTEFCDMFCVFNDVVCGVFCFSGLTQLRSFLKLAVNVNAMLM
jgi:Torsin